MEGKEENTDFYNSAQNPGSLAAKKNTVPKPHHNSFLSLENFGNNSQSELFNMGNHLRETLP